MVLAALSRIIANQEKGAQPLNSAQTLSRGRARDHRAARRRAQPRRADVEPSHVEPSHVEPSHVEPSHVEPSHVEPSHVEPSHVEPSHIEPSHVVRAAAPQHRRTDWLAKGSRKLPGSYGRWPCGGRQRRL